MSTITSAAAHTNASLETVESYPRRADFRYPFSGIIEVQNLESGKQIIAAAATLSRYDCYLQTETAYAPGTSVKV